MKLRHFPSFGGFLLALLAAAPEARPAVLNPTADTFVDSAEPDVNFGAAGALAVSAAGLPNGEFDSFMQFDFSSLYASFLGGARVQSLQLELTSMAPNNPIFNGSGLGPSGSSINTAGSFSIKWIQNDSWLEGDGMPNTPDTDPTLLNFNNHLSYLSANDQSLGTFFFPGGTSGPNTYTLSLTLAPGFLADIMAGNAVSLYISAADSSVSYVFNSVNFRNEAFHPALTVNFTPEPTCSVLLMAGSVLAGRRPRRTAQ